MAAPDPVIMRGFISGEVSPAMGARADLQDYVTGLARCRNCWIDRFGGIVNRPGFRLVNETKTSATASRIVPFVFQAGDQNYLIEFGNLYVRFYWHGAVVLDGAVPLEVVTPYTAAELFELQISQSIDVVVITHPSHAPAELRRNAHDDWELATIVLGPGIEAPANPAGVEGASGDRTISYVVTAAKAGSFEESPASAAVTLANIAEPTIEAPVELSADAVADAQEYYWYKDPFGNGIYGYIGASAGPSFIDPGFAADFTVTPPVQQALFDGADDYPACVAHYQQRRVFARSNNAPETVWASRTGAYKNFSISTPLQDDDSVTFIIAGNRFNPVAHLVALKRLVVLTDEGSHLINGDESGVLKPSAISANQEGYVGASKNVRPEIIGESILYVQNGGAILRDLAFNLQSDGFGGKDLTLKAGHLFMGKTIKEIAYARTPNSILWVVMSDGSLLSLTFVKELDILAWTWHDSGADAVFESVAVLPFEGEDEVYVIVKRTIDGSDVRLVEQLESRHITADTIEDAFFVDSGLTYDGAPATVMSGLDHLEGEVVAVFADGAVVFNGDPTADEAADFTVTGGEITLATAASKVHIGLPITAEIQTLALDVAGSSVRARRKNVRALDALLYLSAATFKAGPAFSDAMPTIKVPTPKQTASGLITDHVEMSLSGRFDEFGQVCIRHTDPLPFHLLGLIPLVEVGG